jgi:hypothetical protein
MQYKGCMPDLFDLVVSAQKAAVELLPAQISPEQQ